MSIARKWVFPILGLVVAAAIAAALVKLAFFGGSTAGAGGEQPTGNIVDPQVPVMISTISNDVLLSGTVNADDAVAVKAPLDGTLATVDVGVGSVVGAGQQIGSIKGVNSAGRSNHRRDHGPGRGHDLGPVDRAEPGNDGGHGRCADRAPRLLCHRDGATHRSLPPPQCARRGARDGDRAAPRRSPVRASRSRRRWRARRPGRVSPAKVTRARVPEPPRAASCHPRSRCSRNSWRN